MKNIVKIFMSIFCFSSSNNLKTQVPSQAEDISPLLIGETIPNATLQDSNGNQIKFKMVIEKKSTVLVFYRGGWCPYCNMQLSGLVKIEKDILDLGYQIVAISPDDYQNLKTIEDKESINYSLFSDPDGRFIQEIGIAFQTPTIVKGYVATKEQKGETSDIMPVPTVMILNEKGKILFEYINPNYKERLSSEMLLAVLKSLKN